MQKLSKLHRSFDSSFWRGLITASFLSVAACCAFGGHVEAHSFRRVHHHHHRIIHHWHRHHWRHHGHRRHAARALPRNAYRYEARVAAESSDILATAERYLGDRNPTGFRGPWCGAFMGMIARMTDHDIPRGFRRAISWIHAGRRVSRPRPGDVAVMRHHVTLFSGYGGRGFLGTGGNQSGHRVTVSSYPISRVIAWVRLR